MKHILLLAACCLYSLLSYSQDYQKGWDALNRHDNAEAKALFEKAASSKTNAADAYFSSYFLQAGTLPEVKMTNILEGCYDQLSNPNPYFYALWFSEIALGDYGRKTDPDQLKTIKTIAADAKTNGSMRAAAHYQMGVHFFFSNKFKESKVEYNKLGSINQWQFVGPFDNLSESGFDKNYGPITDVGPDTEFESVNGSMVKWFTPAIQDEDGWTSPGGNIDYTPSIIYAQSFVQSANDQDIYINVGGTGSLKIWVNDQLVLQEKKQRTTELGYYMNKVHLNKGYNRVLVQLGNTESEYPNFCIRFTDANGELIPGITCTSALQKYTPQTTPNASTESMQHFAEAFFLQKIKDEPDNLVNYLLLSRCYGRNKRKIECIELLEPLVKKYPDNEVILIEYLNSLLGSKDNVKLLEYVDKLRQLSPKSYVALELKINDYLQEEKYDLADKLLDEQIELYGMGSDQYNQKIQLLSRRKEYETMLAMAEEAYAKYPFNVEFNKLMFLIKKELLKDAGAAEKVYEKFLATQFSMPLAYALSESYTGSNKSNKAIQLINKYLGALPGDTEILRHLCSMYFSMKDYKNAEKLAELALQQEPYSAVNLENMALIRLQQGDNEGALMRYRASLAVNPNQFNERDVIRELENKSALRSHIPYDDIEQLYTYIEANKMQSEDENVSIIADWKDVILYPEGPSVNHFTYIVQIHKSDGVNAWKEISIPYNPYSQELIIEKAEIIKSRGAKIAGEVNDNQVVFSKLEVGDVVLVKYKLNDYAFGRMGKEFFDSYVLRNENATGSIRYSIIQPNNKDIDKRTVKIDLQPTKNVIDEEFVQYTWEVKNTKSISGENYAPPTQDVLPMLYLSTLKNWDEIATWYSDLSSARVAEHDEVEVKKAFAECGLSEAGLTDTQKAERIYDYIAKNIKYSSVSFRQSRFLPQSPSKTISTKLGDCKDMSTLFVALAQMSGLKAQLVLVSTLNNGQSPDALPAVDFNHCIVKIDLAGKTHYQELTNNKLSFGAMPQSLIGAVALEIPVTKNTTPSTLIHLPNTTTVKNTVNRTIRLSVKDTDLLVDITTVKSGESAADFRYDFADVKQEERTKSIKESVSEDYKNPLTNFKLDPVDLSQNTPSVQYRYSYTVSNEVTEVGDLQTMKVTFIDEPLNINLLSEETREFPIEMWRLARPDAFHTEVTIDIPAGKKLGTLPKNVELSFKGNTFKIKYEMKSPTSLKVTRDVEIAEVTIQPSDYPAFREFVSKVSKAESALISWK